MNKQNTIHIYSKYAQAFDSKIGTLQNYHESYNDFLNLAECKNSILDLACGPGNISTFIKKQLPEIEISGVDLSPEMLTLAKKKIPNGTFYNADITKLTIPSQKFDLIMCGFGLPYLKQDELSLFFSELQRFSHDKTLCYVSCMKGNESKIEKTSFSGNDTLEIHYHSKEKILDIMEAYNLTCIKYKELEYHESDGSITIDMIFILKFH